ncbi:type III-A CRISPR-associated protein Cas10/Csm1 [Fusobacterium hominis]|uniref:type III-A CRISPR-associated protein Cas10/Csm1 n=1 Tax=Fusobacterium hominis TaxID=2764326 RepID=UPI0015A28F5B|nr:type III-A CRISPR-associated protein Cas10/Csm1 [Fusobacterium hominis]
MEIRQQKLILATLMHDIGKIIYRSGCSDNHSHSGYEFLKNKCKIKDIDILNAVRYHHSKDLKKAKLDKNDIAYVAYVADNIAAAVDRRKNDDEKFGFKKEAPLETVFNILNGNKEKFFYKGKMLSENSGLNFPVCNNEKYNFSEDLYRKIIFQIKTVIEHIDYTTEYLNSLLTLLEGGLSYVPSSTSLTELRDISLYDHMKITAAIATCIDLYMIENKCDDYKKILFYDAQKFYEEKAFLLYSLDISGIQNFIYTISSKGALKGLRARSFYLEFMSEHIIDEILSHLGLSRANLIYSGGGHAYFLLPNTPNTKRILDEIERKNNQWFIHNFDTSLYIAGAYTECSASFLQNIPEGSYSKLYLDISKKISKKKSHRYGVEDIMYLNSKEYLYERECNICKKNDILDEEGRCSICSGLDRLGKELTKKSFFLVLNNQIKNSLPLPQNKYLYILNDENKVKQIMESDTFERCYTKNSLYTGKKVSTKLWVGDYNTNNTFEDFAKKATGIERIAILRADVDNLGQTFVHGFENDQGTKNVTLTRTAALSRQLTLFFKLHINYILSHNENIFFDEEKKDKSRDVAIVYSGGDDVFLVGSWNDVIEAYMDIRDNFRKFTQNTLTISAGIGIYSHSFPINNMAKEVGTLEGSSKELEGKDGITLFESEYAYKYDLFKKNILSEKYIFLKKFFDKKYLFDTNDSKNVINSYGKNFIYNLLELLRNNSEKINEVRYIYLLSRMEPQKNQYKDEDTYIAELANYRDFAKKMYTWIKNEKDRKELILSIYLYVYTIRGSEV